MAQVHAILKVREPELASAHESLATKAELKTEILATKAELKAEILATKAELNAEILGVEGKLSRGVLTCILGQTAVLASLVYFLLGHAGR